VESLVRQYRKLVSDEKGIMKEFNHCPLDGRKVFLVAFTISEREMMTFLLQRDYYIRFVLDRFE
jgi:hypothetical protein